MSLTGKLAVVALATVALGGCMRVHSHVRWTATLDRVPESACVERTIRDTEGLTLKTASHGVAKPRFEKEEKYDQFQFTAAVLYAYISDIVQLSVLQTQGQAPRFQMYYVGPYQPNEPPAKMARRLIDRIAVNCGVPELAARAQPHQDDEIFMDGAGL
jgi:hypothetical protein